MRTLSSRTQYWPEHVTTQWSPVAEKKVSDIPFLQRNSSTGSFLSSTLKDKMELRFPLQLFVIHSMLFLGQ